MRLGAHWWTLWPLLREKVQPEIAPVADPWAMEIEDPGIGPLRLTGALRLLPEARELLILVHGLGGSAEGRYILRAARAAELLGLSTLRLNLRGADRRGEDLYHAGLTSDLEAVLTSPDFAAVERFYVLGYSLGGHLSLKLATEAEEPRLAAVAAVCPPLDLDRTVAAFDRKRAWLYRRYILAHLFEIYAEIERRRDVPTPLEEVRQVETLRDFDRLTVVPRFGFESPEDYYASVGVGARLGHLKVPALLVAAEDDPMVAAEGIHPALDDVPDLLEVRWSRRGGHVSFPADLDLGLGETKGLEGQVLGWLRRR